MLAHVGIALVAYAGYRVVELVAAQSKKRKNKVEFIAAEDVKTPEQEMDDSVNELVSQHQHYASSALISMGLFAGRKFIPILGPAALAMSIYSLIPIIKRAERSLLSKENSGTELATLVMSVVLLGFSQYLLLSSSLWAVHSSRGKIVRMLYAFDKDLLKPVFEPPEKVWVRRGSVEQEVDVADLALGDRVLINNIGVMAITGVIEEGQLLVHCKLDGALLELEKKQVGSEIHQDAFVVSGNALVRVTHL